MPEYVWIYINMPEYAWIWSNWKFLLAYDNPFYGFNNFSRKNKEKKSQNWEVSSGRARAFFLFLFWAKLNNNVHMYA